MMSQLNLSYRLLFISILSVSSYPNGAPESACQSMMPVHQGVSPQPSPAPYIFKVGSSSFQNGKPIQVQILGPEYRGILLESRTFENKALLGKWVQPPNNTKILQCPENPDGAITHSNTNLKISSTTYTWTPPDSDCPSIIFFIATVAQSREVYWLGIQSAVLWKDPAATCSTEKMSWKTAIFSILCFKLAIVLIF